MVKATFVHGTRLPYRGFVLEGHAGFASKGEDIVCAGISSLALSIALGLQEYLDSSLQAEQGEDGWLKLTVVEIKCGVEELIRTEALLGTLKLGLESINQRYPGSIEISESEVFPDDSF